MKRHVFRILKLKLREIEERMHDFAQFYFMALVLFLFETKRCSI